MPRNKMLKIAKVELLHCIEVNFSKALAQYILAFGVEQAVKEFSKLITIFKSEEYES